SCANPLRSPLYVRRPLLSYSLAREASCALPLLHARALACAPFAPPLPARASPRIASPNPAPPRSPGVGLPRARLSLPSTVLTPIGASSPIARLLRTPPATVLFAPCSRAPCVAPNTPTPIRSRSSPKSPNTGRVLLTFVAGSSAAHPRTLGAARVSCSIQPRASWADARHSLISRSPSSSLLSFVSIGSGHGSHPSNPLQSPAHHIQPSSTLCLSLLRASIFQSRLFSRTRLALTLPFLSLYIAFPSSLLGL
ncbi:Unknown protein, partial [Striga hermonthica]